VFAENGGIVRNARAGNCQCECWKMEIEDPTREEV
jgi:hypothetical protein